MKPVRIVHLSDLHFTEGASKPREVWESVCSFVKSQVEPDLILVTGDVTDGAKDEEFAYAKECLDELVPTGLPFRVIPGNHDRFALYGNALPWLTSRTPVVRRYAKRKAKAFDDAFPGSVHLTAKDRLDIELPEKTKRRAGRKTWNVRIVGVDSSENEQWFAQGAVKKKSIDAVCSVASDNASDRHLVVALVHHHVLPIPDAEEASQKSWWGRMANVTSLVNSGTLLEQFSMAHINIVLHGHEHYSYQACYRAYKEASSDVVVIAAGSGTGEKSRVGWSLGRVHFNVLELENDGSIWLCQVGGIAVERKQGDAGDEAQVPTHRLDFLGDRKLLLRAEDVRKARFLRRTKTTQPAQADEEAGQAARHGKDHERAEQKKSETPGLPRSRLKKIVEFTPSRDVRITETRTDWTMKEAWTQTTRNSTGVLSKALVTIEWKDGKPQSGEHVFLPTGAAGVHRLVVPLASGAGRLAARVTSTWEWRGGGALSAEEMLQLPTGARSELRSLGYECGGVEILSTDEFESLSLTVRVPAGYAPAPSEVKVLVKEPGKEGFEDSTELLHGLQFCGFDTFELHVPYPLPDYRYAIAWPPPHVSEALYTSDEVKQYSAVVKAHAEELVEHAAGVLRTTGRLSDAAVALFAVNGNSTHLDLCAANPRRSLDRLRINDVRSLARCALWGRPVVSERDPYAEHSDFYDGEEIVGLAPVAGLSAAGMKAMGILRVALRSNPLDRRDPEKAVEWLEKFENILAESAHTVLQKARLRY